jgi:hypothetical protein
MAAQSATLRAQQEALAGTRGPPTELLVQGGSNYRSDNLRAATARPAAGSRATPSPPALSAVSAVLAQAEARLAEAPSGPVHVHDLHEIAMRTQQQLIERDSMVRCAGGSWAGCLQLCAPSPSHHCAARTAP